MSLARWSFATHGPLDAASVVNARSQRNATMAAYGQTPDAADDMCFDACVALASSLLSVAPGGAADIRVGVESGHTSATQPHAQIAVAWSVPGSAGASHSWSVGSVGQVGVAADPLLAAEMTADLAGVGRTVEAGDTTILAATANAARAWLQSLGVAGPVVDLAVSATISDGSLNRATVSVGLSVAGPAPAAPSPLAGVVTPPPIVGTANNYNPTGLAGASDLRVSSTAASTITGLAGGSGTRLLRVYNVGTANVTLAASSALSAAGNRFLTNGNVLLNPNEGLTLVYDPVALGWRAVGALL